MLKLVRPRHHQWPGWSCLTPCWTLARHCGGVRWAVRACGTALSQLAKAPGSGHPSSALAARSLLVTWKSRRGLHGVGPLIWGKENCGCSGRREVGGWCPALGKQPVMLLMSWKDGEGASL